MNTICGPSYSSLIHNKQDMGKRLMSASVSLLSSLFFKLSLSFQEMLTVDMFRYEELLFFESLKSNGFVRDMY